MGGSLRIRNRTLEALARVQRIASQPPVADDDGSVRESGLLEYLD